MFLIFLYEFSYILKVEYLILWMVLLLIMNGLKNMKGFLMWDCEVGFDIFNCFLIEFWKFENIYELVDCLMWLCKI